MHKPRLRKWGGSAILSLCPEVGIVVSVKVHVVGVDYANGSFAESFFKRSCFQIRIISFQTVRVYQWDEVYLGLAKQLPYAKALEFRVVSEQPQDVLYLIEDKYGVDVLTGVVGCVNRNAGRSLAVDASQQDDCAQENPIQDNPTLPHVCSPLRHPVSLQSMI